MDIQQVLQQLGVNDEDVPDMLDSLATQAYREYQTSGSREVIDMAVEFAKLSVFTEA